MRRETTRAWRIFLGSRWRDFSRGLPKTGGPERRMCFHRNRVSRLATKVFHLAGGIVPQDFLQISSL
jgi:hypothetical protein